MLGGDRKPAGSVRDGLAGKNKFRRSCVQDLPLFGFLVLVFFFFLSI